MKMDKKMLTFVKIEIKKKNFYCNKIPFSKKYGNFGKVLVSNKIYFGEKSYKYFYNDHKVKPLDIMPFKTNACVKFHDEQSK